jgi:cysteine desulfurase
MSDSQIIYLDNAATTPLDPAVLAAMQPYLTEQFYNPSAQYLAARSVKKDLDGARAAIAHHLGARPSEVIFTAGGTEANNLVINGVMRQYQDANVVVSSIEHDSVLKPASQYSIKITKVTHDGRINQSVLFEEINDKTVLVSIQYANNEIGTVQPIADIARQLAEIRRARQKAGNPLPLYLHTDACQAPAYLDIHAARLGVDFMTINASKIYGPKQIGALFVRGGTILLPQILGGGQERGQRSGTENVASIIGFAKALELVQERRHSESKRLRDLQKLFITLLESQVPDVVINGSLKFRLPNNVHITIPGQDNERLMMQLDEAGILCAVGSACSASSEEPSHVLTAIGLSDQDAQASLRFTMGIMTTEADIRRVAETLAKLVK